MPTNLGTLNIFAESPEDIVFSYNVENNDDVMVNDASDLKWLSTSSGIEGIDFVTTVGQDLTLSEFAQKIEEMGGVIQIDAQGIPCIMFNMKDSSQSLFQYRIDIAIIYSTEEPDSYTEAKQKVEGNKI